MPEPSLVQRFGYYATAISKWIAEGRPVRTPDEIDRLLAICEECEYRVPATNHRPAREFTCAKCGCCGSRSPVPWFNKLAMQSEKCPVGKW